MSLSNLLGADPGYIDHLEEADRVAGRTTLERRCEEFEEKLKSWGKCSSERTKDPMAAHFPFRTFGPVPDVQHARRRQNFW